MELWLTYGDEQGSPRKVFLLRTSEMNYEEESFGFGALA